MKKILEQFFIDNGERFQAPGDEPVFLKQDYVWYVAEGDIDIFSVKIKSKKPVGVRYQIGRILAGNVFFLLRPESGNEEGFIAVGTFDTYLYKIDIDTFKTILDNNDYIPELSTAIDNWILLLNQSLNWKTIKGEYTNIIDEGTIEVKKDIPFRSPNNIKWCELSGKSNWIDEIQLDFGDNKGLFPLTGNTWITSDIDLDLVSYNTFDCMKNEKFYESLNIFNSKFCEAIRCKKILETAEEAKRLSQKNIEDAGKLEKGLRKLSSCFVKGKAADVFAEVGDDLLFTSMCIVGKSDGIQFLENPKAIHKENIENRIRVISEASNVRFRKIILKDKWYTGDSGPILGFEQNSMCPVAIVPPSPGKYYIHHPEEKKSTLINKEISEKLLPFGYVFYRPLPEKQLNYKDIFSFSLKGNFKSIIGVIILSLIGALLGLVTPWATGIIFDTVIPEAGRSQLLQIAIIVFTCSITISLLSLTKSITIQRFSSKAGYKVQAAIWDRLLSLPVTFFKKYTAGDLAQRSMGVNHIRSMMDNVVITTLTNSIFSIGYLCLLFYYSVSLALVGLTISLIFIIITALMSYVVLRYQKKLIKIEGEIAGIVLQFITGISKLRMNGAEDRAFYQWADKFSDKKKLAMKTGIVNNIGTVINSFFPILASIIIFAWVILKLTQGALSAGQYMAFNSAYLSMQSALLQMSSTFISILSVIPIYKRLKPILTELPEVSLNKPSPGKLTGRIEVNNISFKYGPKEPEVLKDITLKVNKGEFVAVVGASGSGKSTLMRILLGFEKPNMGTVFYDNNDISHIDIKEVRRQIGVVLQNSSLMQGSIYENIVGASALTIDDAWDAAYMAGCGDDIKEMPMQMHTVIGVGGGTISGGQKQRIMIARALVKKPKILFFDEATSALDNKTQAIVSRTVERLNVTRIVIAHRLSTIINADKIFVMDNGHIVQQGTYSKLMEEEGTFSKLAKRQII